MKKLTVLLALCAIVLISSCTKEGPTGPTGPQGPQGVTGSTGSTGSNASTAYQLNFTVQPTDWVTYGTSGTAGCGVEAYLASSYLSYSSVGNGAVLVYELYTDGQRQAVPFIDYNTSGTQFNTQFIWSDGGVHLDIYNSIYQPTTYSTAINFTVVIVPGVGKTILPVDLSNYNQVVAYFHPRTVH